MAACGHRLDVTSSNSEVSKALAFLALGGVALKHRSQHSNDLILRDGLRVECVQTFANEVSTEVHVVRAWCFSDEAYLGHRWPSTRVRATSHANCNICVP